MIRIENRFQLKQVRAECQAETKQEKCRVLICGGTGCLAGGSAKLYEHMKELAAEHENVQVEIGPEIAHIGVHKSGCHGFCEMGPLMRPSQNDAGKGGGAAQGASGQGRGGAER